MSSEIKIKNLKKEIIAIQIEPFKYWLDDVLLICESEIETQMMLQLIYHLQIILFDGIKMGEPGTSMTIQFKRKYISRITTKEKQSTEKSNYSWNGIVFLKR